MSTHIKAEVRKRWLDLAMQLYAILPEEKKIELFRSTCATASQRYTVAELNGAIRNLERQIRSKEAEHAEA